MSAVKELRRSLNMTTDAPIPEECTDMEDLERDRKELLHAFNAEKADMEKALKKKPKRAQAVMRHQIEAMEAKLAKAEVEYEFCEAELLLAEVSGLIEGKKFNRARAAFERAAEIAAELPDGDRKATIAKRLKEAEADIADAKTPMAAEAQKQFDQAMAKFRGAVRMQDFSDAEAALAEAGHTLPQMPDAEAPRGLLEEARSDLEAQREQAKIDVRLAELETAMDVAIENGNMEEAHAALGRLRHEAEKMARGAKLVEEAEKRLRRGATEQRQKRELATALKNAERALEDNIPEVDDVLAQLERLARDAGREDYVAKSAELRVRRIEAEFAETGEIAAERLAALRGKIGGGELLARLEKLEREVEARQRKRSGRKDFKRLEQESDAAISAWNFDKAAGLLEKLEDAAERWGDESATSRLEEARQRLRTSRAHHEDQQEAAGLIERVGDATARKDFSSAEADLAELEALAARLNDTATDDRLRRLKRELAEAKRKQEVAEKWEALVAEIEEHMVAARFGEALASIAKAEVVVGQLGRDEERKWLKERKRQAKQLEKQSRKGASADKSSEGGGFLKAVGSLLAPAVSGGREEKSMPQEKPQSVAPVQPVAPSVTQAAQVEPPGVEEASAYLEIHSGTRSGTHFPLPIDGELWLGRGKPVDGGNSGRLLFPDPQCRLQPDHACLRTDPESGEVTIENHAASLQATKVNSKRLRKNESVRLKEGDTIQLEAFESVRLTFRRKKSG